MKTTTWYMPVGVRADGTLKYYHDHKHTDIEVAKQNIKEIKRNIKAYPDLFENCAEFKIMKRTVTITATEWEDAE